MDQNLFDKLRMLRNEIAHGKYGFNSAELAKSLSEMGLSIPAADLPEFTALLVQVLGKEAGSYYVPQSLLNVLAKLLDGRSAGIVCDPWAGMGTVLATVGETTKATRALAFTISKSEAELGRVLLSSADWQVGDPCQLLGTLPGEFDIVASVLPFGTKRSQPLKVQTSCGASLTLQDDWGHLILVAFSMRLSVNGVGLFVVPGAFFSQKSVFRKFDALGIGISAALALPSGTFAPYTRIPTYLVVVEKRASSRMFLSQLSTDANTNFQVIENFKHKQEGTSLELGRFVDVSTFTGIGALRASERFEQAKGQFGYPAVRIGELATEINLGRHGNNFSFPKRDNAIFVPLIGSSDVVDSADDMTLKQQNYAQVVIDSKRSDARFVTRFLNSEFGKELLEHRKMGTIIPKLNSQSLLSFRSFHVESLNIATSVCNA